MSLKNKIISGSKWVYIRIILNQFMNILAVAILARKLDPSAFGIVALANVILHITKLLSTQHWS